MANVVKNPNQLQLVKNKFSNPLENRNQKASDWTDSDDAYYWAFQDALDHYGDDADLDTIEQYLGEEYDSRFDGSTFPKNEWIHNGLNIWNTHNKIYPNPRRTDVEIWKDRARKLAKENPNDAFYNNILQIVDDVNGVDHSDKIQKIIDAFGFNRNGEW